MARNVYSNPRLEESSMRSKDGCKLYVKMTGHPLNVNMETPYPGNSNPIHGITACTQARAGEYNSRPHADIRKVEVVDHPNDTGRRYGQHHAPPARKILTGMREKLCDVFQQYGKVLDVFVSDKNWAFVTFEDKKDAQTAIATLSRRNGSLQASYAHDGAKRSNRYSDDFLGSPNVRNMGRGQILNNPQFDGRHRPGMFEEAVFQDELEEPYYSNIQCTVDDRGKRISKGFISDGSDRRSLGWVRSDSDGPTYVVEGDCKLCNRPAAKECAVCSMPYCSRRCQLEDFHRHKLECTIPPLIDRRTVEQLEEISKDDWNANKLQNARSKDASNKSIEKDSRGNADKEVIKNGNYRRNEHSTENSTASRSHRNKQDVQDFSQNHREGGKKYSDRYRNQNGNETARSGKSKGIQSPPDCKHQDQKAGNTMAKAKDLETRESTADTVRNNEKRESTADTVRNNEKRKSTSDKFTEDTPSTPDFKQQHKEVGNSMAASREIEDLEIMNESSENGIEVKLPPNRFTEVIITVPVRPDTYWVQSSSTLQMTLDVYKAVSAVGASSQESYEPKVGELCIAPFQGDWFRARVISLQPKPRVLFIDYGNEDFCSPDDIKKLPETCKNISPLAFRIKLIPGTNKKYYNLTADTQIKVKPVGSVKDNEAVVVCVEGDEPQPESAVKEVYAVHKLKEGEQGMGKIIKPGSEDDAFVMILTESLKKDFLTVMQLDKLVSELPVEDFKLNIGDIVAAEAEEEGLLDCQWGRAVILAIHNEKYLVHFVDHCLVLRTKNVRRLPRDVAEIPKFGTKLTILEYKKPVNGCWTQLFKTEGKFPFTVEEVNRNKNVTVAISKGEEKVCRAILSYWSPISDANSVRLTDGIEVIITFFDLKYIYVRPVSISYVQMFNDLEEDLGKHYESVSQLSCIPPLKSLVACKYGKNSTYYRAQVIAICQDLLKLYFVDNGNEDTVKLETVKPLRDDLKLYPFMAEKILLRNIAERDLSSEGTRLLMELCQDKIKLKVKLSNEIPSGIGLIMKDGTPLNKKLRAFYVQREKKVFIHAPKKQIPTDNKSESSPAVEKKSESSPATESKSLSFSLTNHSVPSASADEIYRLDEQLEYEGLPVGKTVELLVLHKFNETDFTCCRRDSAALAECIGKLQEEITAYCSTCEEQYRPRELGELCLAKFEDDGMWYRAVCIQNTDENTQKVKIVFIDFGNVAEVAICHIRRMVSKFLSTPAVAHPCSLEGSEQMSEAKKNIVGSLVEISNTYKANIIASKEKSSYIIEMPHVTKALSS